MIGAIIAASVLYVIATGRTGGYDVAVSGLGQNGWSDYSVTSVFLYEVIATAIFLIVILGATQDGKTTGNEGLIIGLTLVVIHLAGIALSGALARSGAVCRR